MPTGRKRRVYVNRLVCRACGGDFDPYTGDPAPGHKPGCPTAESEAKGIKAPWSSYHEFSEAREVYELDK